MPESPVQETSPRSTALSVAVLAAAVLLLEGVLLRLLAVAQFYHFAFLVVSLALLGFGASGTLLSLSSRLQAMPLDRLLARVGLLFAASVAVSYVTATKLPFDSYSIAWDRKQILFFVLYYLALSLPFLVGGLGIGASLSKAGLRSNRIYAANLLGSAAGALLAPLTLALAGLPGALLASAALPLTLAWRGMWRWLVAVLLALALAAFAGLTWLNLQGEAPLGIAVSPYKGLAHALRYPGSQRVFAAWNAFSRVDAVANAGTRQLPGLSYAYPGTPPPQLGLAVDAADLQPITQVAPDRFEAAAYLPEAVAFSLRPAVDRAGIRAGRRAGCAPGACRRRGRGHRRARQPAGAPRRRPQRAAVGRLWPTRRCVLHPAPAGCSPSTIESTTTSSSCR